MRSEEDDVDATGKKFQDLSEDRSERNFFVRHEFSEGEGSVSQKHAAI